MKLTIFAILACASTVLTAQVPQKQIIVSYQDPNTPQHIIDQAMTAIKEAGGMITHEYSLIKGFAAKAPAKVLESVSAWGAEYKALIEEDQMVSAVGSGSK